MSTDESENKNNKKVQLDLNNEIFLDGLLDLDKDERNRVLETLKKITETAGRAGKGPVGQATAPEKAADLSVQG